MTNDDKNIRDSIINAASELFAKFGFKKTTMDEIARAARKGKSSLYHYFNSKEDVFQAVLEKESNLIKEEVRKALEKEDSLIEKVRVYILTRMRMVKRLGNYYSAIRDEYYDNYGFIEKMRTKYFLDEAETIENILREGVETGIFNIKELELTAVTIIIALKGLEFSWLFEKGIYDEMSIDNMLEVLFYGIMKR